MHEEGERRHDLRERKFARFADLVELRFHARQDFSGPNDTCAEFGASGSHARSISAACANLSPQGPDSALKWRAMQICKRPPPALTSPQEWLMALSRVLSEEQKERRFG